MHSTFTWSRTWPRGLQETSEASIKPNQTKTDSFFMLQGLTKASKPSCKTICAFLSFRFHPMSCANSKIVSKYRAVLLSSVLNLWRCTESVRGRAELPVSTEWWKRSAICSISWLSDSPPAAIRPCRRQLWISQVCACFSFSNSCREPGLQYSFACFFMFVFAHFCLWVCLNLAAHPQTSPVSWAQSGRNRQWVQLSTACSISNICCFKHT